MRRILGQAQLLADFDVAGLVPRAALIENGSTRRDERRSASSATEGRRYWACGNPLGAGGDLLSGTAIYWACGDLLGASLLGVRRSAGGNGGICVLTMLNSVLVAGDALCLQFASYRRLTCLV